MGSFVRIIFILWVSVIMSSNGVMAAGDIAPDRKTIAAKLFRTGETFYADRQYALAMKNYLDALRIAEHNGADELTAMIYNGIGNLYSTQGDYQMGLYFYRKALAMSRRGKHSNRNLQNAILNNLVGASCFVGQTDSIIAYFNMMVTNVEHTPDYHYNILMGRGLIAKSQNRQDEAAGYYLKAENYARSKNLDNSFIDISNSCLAQLYIDNGNPDSAIYYLKKNEKWARSTKQNSLLAEAMNQLARAYDAKGDGAQATACRLEYARLLDTLHRSDEFNTMKNAQFMFDAKRNASKISFLTQKQTFSEQQIRMQNRWLVTLAIGIVLVAVLLVWVYVQKRQLRQAYNSLYDRSQVLPTTSPMILSDMHRAELLDNIRNVMESTDEFCSPDFSIERLAQLVDSNSRYVSEAINDGYGKNFRTFLNEYRIREAMRRLADSERFGGFAIKAIAESVGYKSQANFITVFTKTTGMKPSMYQKISKERVLD